MKLLKPILIIALFLFNYIENCSVITKYATIAALKTDTVKKTHQHNLPPPPKPFSNKYESYNDCMYVKRYSLKQRLRHYPFSKAAKIIAVSYPCGLNADIILDSEKTPKPSSPPILRFTDSIFNSDLHIRNGILNYSSLKETKQLTAIQIDKLTRIIYNTTYKKLNHIVDMGFSCYIPRNALLFYDKNGKIFDYLEICFECQRNESLSEKITIGTYCNQKYELLRQFFINTGIKYGTLQKQ